VIRTRRHVAVLVGTLLLLVGACKRGEQGTVTSSAPFAARPTVIFIMVDTLRADRLACYGYRRANAPTIDALAREGVLFERTIAASPWTQPSIASLFSSWYPTAHGVLGYREAYEATVDETKHVTVFAESFRTLAESMQEAGYATAAFVANPFLVESFGFAQGFDHFDDSFANNLTTGDVVNAAAVKWLADRDTQKPLFLYLHYMDAHGPYSAPPRFLDPLIDDLERTGVRELLSPEAVRRLDYLYQPPTGPTDLERHNRLNHYREYWSARYEAGIRQVDFYLSELEAKLTEMGLWQNAYIILTADHGEALDEHGYWDHGFSAHHTDLHVPLILRWSGKLPRGTRIADLTRLIDLLPTLREQFDLQPLVTIQGVSLVPILAGDDRSDAITAYAEGVKIGPEQRAIYVGAWKLLLTVDTDEVNLYHIVRDPLEQEDLAAKHPKLAAELRALLMEQHERNKKLAEGVETQQAPLTDEQIERLRTLGYLGD